MISFTRDVNVRLEGMERLECRQSVGARQSVGDRQSVGARQSVGDRQSVGCVQRKRVILGLVLVLVWGVGAQCPDRCVCAGTELRCRLQEIPETLPNTTTDVTFTGNNLTYISNATFRHLPELRTIDISNNQIEAIHPDAFRFLYKLKVIKLDGNLISRIENGTFANLRLSSLTINNNPNLSFIDLDAFRGSDVTKLELSGCSFVTFHPQTFHDLQISLQYLTLSLNLLPLNLPDGLFRGFAFEQIIFQYDQLSSVAFLSGAKVAVLDLTGNRQLGNGVWNVTRDLALVEELIISDVNITSVQIEHENEIEGLDLSNNNIEYIDGSMFQYTKNLFTLILTNNRLTEIPKNLGQFIPRLIILILSHNELGPVLDPELLNGTSLHVLELQHCGIQVIPASGKAILGGMRTVKLAGNPLHCNCEMRWLNEWVRGLKYGETDVRLGECASPTPAAGELFTQQRPGEMVCSTPLLVFTAQSRAVPGRRVDIQCKASGEPAPGLTLERQRPDGRFDLVASQPASPNRTVTETLLYYSTPPYACADSATYRCSANNLAGGASEPLTVGEPPDGACGESTATPLPDTTRTTTGTTDVSTTTTTVKSTTLKSAPSQDSEDTGDGSENADFVLPLVICVVLLLLIGMVVIIILWEKKTRKKYDLCNRQRREPRIAYINNAMEFEDQAASS